MLKTLDEFLAQWIKAGEEHYEEVKNRYIAFLQTPDAKNAYKNADMTKALFGSKQLGWEAGIRLRASFNCHDETYENYTEYMHEILVKEAARKKKQLEIKIKKEVGNITKVSLMIGMDGSLNGYVEGELGKVTINTIDAGGYNIQRYHYRVLVKRIKE